MPSRIDIICAASGVAVFAATGGIMIYTMASAMDAASRPAAPSYSYSSGAYDYASVPSLRPRDPALEEMKKTMKRAYDACMQYVQDLNSLNDTDVSQDKTCRSMDPAILGK